jgi:hypothetical protein
MVAFVTEVGAIVAVAVVGVVLVPVNTTVGTSVYPLPPSVRVMELTVDVGQCILKVLFAYLWDTLYQLYGICRLVIMICETSGTVKLPFLNLYS